MKTESLRRVGGASAAPGEAWRIERKVPLSLIFMLAGQLAALIIWAAWLDARVTAMERAQEASRGMDARFARLEERLDAVREDVAFLRKRWEK